MQTPHQHIANIAWQVHEAGKEIERLRGLLKRCEPFMLILEGVEESKEAEFWKLIDEVKKEIKDE